jgi:hypothetical protein
VAAKALRRIARYFLFFRIFNDLVELQAAQRPRSFSL